MGLKVVTILNEGLQAEKQFCFLWLALMQEKSCPPLLVKQAPEELDEVLLWRGAFPDF